jgi:hypothetical protein
MFRRLAVSLLLFLPPCAFSLSEDVPFVVTPDNVTLEMLKLANVGPKDYLIDLGSGDGRIVIVAAKRFGARGVGVEIVPDLVKQSRENAKQAGVADRAQFREQDLFETDLSKATVVTLYCCRVNSATAEAARSSSPARASSPMTGTWATGIPDRTIEVDAPDKTIGREKKSRIPPQGGQVTDLSLPPVAGSIIVRTCEIGWREPPCSLLADDVLVRRLVDAIDLDVGT